MPGVATGLAWTPVGGDILFLEATKMPGSKGFQITGSIGKVMQESAQTRFHWCVHGQKNSELTRISTIRQIFTCTSLPEQQPKDGPSAGVTIVTALVSLLKDKKIASDLAMTGEISLKGQVLPVGGIKEKVLAAHRAKLTRVILPRQNQLDLEDIPEEIQKTMNFILVDTIDEVLENAF